MLLATLRIALQEGKTDTLIQEEMALDTGDYNALKSELYEQEKTDINNKSVEDVFIDFTHRMEGCIRDLNGIISNAKANHNAVVGAVRAKADIINRIIDRGQEFGLIEKIPEKKQIVGGILVAQLPNKELRELIMKQTGEMGKLMEKYGDTDMMDEPPALPEHVPSPAPASEATVTFAPVGKTGKATGGLAKAAGGKATAHKPSRPTA